MDNLSISGKDSAMPPTDISVLENANETEAVTPSPSYLPWNNPYDLVSHEAQYIVYLVLSCGLSQFLCLLGIPGNVLNMMVFAKQGLRDRVNFLLFVLAASDVTLLIVLLVYKARCYLEPIDLILSMNVDAFMGVSLYYLAYIFSSTSQFLIAILSVDRCITITFPFIANRITKFRYIALTVSATFAFFIGIFVPHFFYYNITWRLDLATNRSVVFLQETEFGKENKNILYAFARELNLLVVKPIGTVLVVTCSVITFVHLRRARRTRRDITAKQTSSADAKITRMLLFVSTISFVCVCPEIMVAFTNMFVPEFEYFKKYHNLVLVVFNVIFLAWIINSSVNFLIYVKMSSRFRVTLVNVIPCFGRCFVLRRSVYRDRNECIANTHVHTISGTELSAGSQH